MLKGEAEDSVADPGAGVFPKGEDDDTDGAGAEPPKRFKANPRGELAAEDGAAAVPGETAVAGTAEEADSVAAAEDSCLRGRSLPTSFM